MKSYLKISPVGGVKQIGSNCTLIETNSQRLLIDCGILFPNEGVFDINYLIVEREIIQKTSCWWYWWNTTNMLE